MVKIVIFKLQICNNNITLVSTFTNIASSSFVFLIFNDKILQDEKRIYKLKTAFSNSTLSLMYRFIL